ncbi:MAG TPA: phosphoenolpyruvate--protein phosphotransferase [Kouleothrix sp.]|nr:phosphoenolpyruvate--protein phosphotransferase [Kouleothrix sp.]HRC74101.1 phosphoenolpyruvate--protein phosphotransferase [Kouleothrix sp.]
MQQLNLVIHNATGLHARPARAFVDLAKQFRSTIKIRHGEKQVNAKSLISVLTLGVRRGEQIVVDVSGDDEEHAAAAIVAAVRDGLGEGPDAGEHAAITPAVPAPTAPAHQQPAGAGAVIQGIAGAPGIAIGPVFRFERIYVEVRERFAGVDKEHARLQSALEAAQHQLNTLHAEVAQRADASEAAIFQVHHEILSDPGLIDAVRAAIADGRSAAEAWQIATAEHAAELAELSDALLAERAADIRDVGARVLRLLTGAGDAAPALPDESVIVVANDLTPSETVALDPQRVLGFCTAVGGPNAHTAILARALGLPAIVSAGAGVLELAAGTQVILDGGTGMLTVSPSADLIADARAAQRRQQQQRADAARSAAEPAVTADGHRVEIVANIGGADEVGPAVEGGAEGVGLFRTEVIFLDPKRVTEPTEEEQFAIYRDVAKAFGGQPVIIRTLDIGGDKEVAYLDLPREDNPFLGVRGLRLCLEHPDLFRTQLRAILRAASFGKLRIMFPMVADIGELRTARAIVEQLRAELGAPPVEVGIMIEVPSAALMADVLAREADFFSIGTNDLTQYTLAMDRMHPTLASQADDLHPAVLRLIAKTVEGAHAAGKWVGVCGNLGSKPQAVPILVGLGVDELSIAIKDIPLVKAQIRTLTLAQCQERARQALQCATAAEVRAGE